MYTVISAFTKFFFLLIYVICGRPNLKTGRRQSVLFRYLLSFFHSSPAAGSSCVCASSSHASHLALALHHALESTSAFQPKAGICQESEIPKFGFLAAFSPQLLGKTQAAPTVLKVL